MWSSGLLGTGRALTTMPPRFPRVKVPQHEVRRTEGPHLFPENRLVHAQIRHHILERLRWSQWRDFAGNAYTTTKPGLDWAPQASQLILRR